MLTRDSARSDPPDEQASALVRQVELAHKLARRGARQPARNLCAAIFLDQSALLLADRSAKRRFVECLLLLDMVNLLGRLLRALDGVELGSRQVVVAGTRQMVLSLSNGVHLVMPVADTLPRVCDVAHWAGLICSATESLATEPSSEWDS